MNITSYLKRIFTKIEKEKIEPEEVEEKIEQELLRKHSGEIVIKYFADNGDFTVAAEADDLSEESAEMLALMMFHMSSGELESFIFEALRLWAGNEDDRVKFNVMTSIHASKLESLVLDVEDQEDEVEEDVAVRASEVFNFKEMRQQ